MFLLPPLYSHWPARPHHHLPDLFSSIEFPSEEAEYEATKDDEEQYRDLVSKNYTLGIQPGEKGFPI